MSGIGEQLRAEAQRVKDDIKNNPDKHINKLQKNIKRTKKELSQKKKLTDMAGELKDINKMTLNHVSNLFGTPPIEEELEQSSTAAEFIMEEAPPGKCSHLELVKIYDGIVENITSDLKTKLEQFELLTDTVDVKTQLLKNMDRTGNLIDEKNELDKNYIVTTGRLTHFYNDNIKVHNTINAILKLIFVVVAITFIFIFKTEMKIILKEAGQLLYDIFTGNIPSISSIISNIPLIACLLNAVSYGIWELNKHDIREISYPMIVTFIVYVIFIRYLILQFKDTALSPAIHVLSILPFIFYYITEKNSFDSNIIPIYDKNIKLAYKQSMTEPRINSINSNMKDLDKNVRIMETDIIGMEDFDP